MNGQITAAAISEYVEKNREEALQCLSEIVQTPSVTGDELAVSKVFTRWIEKAGLEVKQYAEAEGRPNLLAEWRGSRPGKRFVFNGHMDVFPPDAKNPGPFGPWAGKIAEDGNLYGRGAADMKGGDCGALMAVSFLKRMGFDPRGSILLSYMVDEENGGGKGVKYLLKNRLIEGDFGICMEPTCGKILVAHGGIVRAYCTYMAEPRHSGRRYSGDNALKKAVRAITELYKIDERLAETEPKNFEKPCLSVTVFHAGTAANVHPAKATFAIDRRLVPGEDHEEALREIVDVLERLKEQDPAYAYELEVTSKRPFLDIPEDDPFISLLLRSYEQVMGRPTEVYRRSGGSDAANIREATGMPMPNFGIANDVDDSGSPNEKISVQGYLDFIKVYMMAVVNALS